MNSAEKGQPTYKNVSSAATFIRTQRVGRCTRRVLVAAALLATVAVPASLRAQIKVDPYADDPVPLHGVDPPERDPENYRPDDDPSDDSPVDTGFPPASPGTGPTGGPGGEGLPGATPGDSPCNPGPGLFIYTGTGNAWTRLPLITLYAEGEPTAHFYVHYNSNVITSHGRFSAPAWSNDDAILPAGWYHSFEKFLIVKGIPSTSCDNLVDGTVAPDFWDDKIFYFAEGTSQVVGFMDINHSDPATGRAFEQYYQGAGYLTRPQWDAEAGTYRTGYHRADGSVMGFALVHPCEYECQDEWYGPQHWISVRLRSADDTCDARCDCETGQIDPSSCSDCYCARLWRLEFIRDRRGRLTTLQYADTASAGLWPGYLESVTDPYGRTITFSYAVPDGSNAIRLSEVQSPDGTVVRFDYTPPAGNLLARISIGGHTFYEYAYDAEGRISYEHRADGSEYWYAYTDRTVTVYDDLQGQTTDIVLEVEAEALPDDKSPWSVVLDPMSGQWVYAGGEVTVRRYHDPDGDGTPDPLEWIYQINDRGRVASITAPADTQDGSPLAVTTTYEYIDGGRLPVSRTVSDGTSQITETYEWDTWHGVLTAFTDGAGNRTEYEYGCRILNDAWNQVLFLRRITMAGPPGTPPEDHRQWTFEYDFDFDSCSTGQPSDCCAPNGEPARGDLLQIVDPLGRITAITWTYDPATPGALAALEVSDPDGIVETRTYSRLPGEWSIDVARSGGSETSPIRLDYDPSTGRLRRVDRVPADPQNPPWSVAYTYDPAGRLGAVTRDPEGLSLTTTIDYDRPARRIVVTNPAGLVTEYSLTARGDLAALTVDPGGFALITTYEYDQAGRLIAVTDQRGTRTEISYYDFGAPQTVRQTSTDGATELRRIDYTYDLLFNATSRSIAVDDTRSQTTRYERDALGRITTVSYEVAGEADIIYTYEYDSTFGCGCPGTWGSSLPRRITAPASDDTGRTWIYIAYDALARPTRFVLKFGPEGDSGPNPDPTDLVWTLDYNATGIGLPSAPSVAVTNPAGEQTVFGYDGWGRLRAIVHGWDGSEALARTAIAYDGSGPLYETQHIPGGAFRRYIFDGAGRLREIRDDTTNPGTPDSPLLFLAYDNADNLTALTDAEGNAWQFDYDILGRVVRALDPILENPHDAVIEYIYNAAGDLWKRITDQNQTTYLYDALGRLLQTIEEDIPYIPGDFDRDGDVDNTDWATFAACYGCGPCDPSCQPADFDGDGDVDIIDYNTFASNFTGPIPPGTYQQRSITYEYDKRDALVAVRDDDPPAGGRTEFHYDELGRLLWMLFPADEAGSQDEITFAYYPSGRLKSRTDGRGTTTFFYDEAHRLVRRQTTASPAHLFEYDRAGRLIAARVDGGTDIEFAYDRIGRVVSRTQTYPDTPDPTTWSVSLAYASLSEVEITFPSQRRTTYTLDRRGRLDTLSTTLAATTTDIITSSNWSLANRLLARHLGNNIETTYTWDPVGRITSLAHVADPAGQPQTLWHFDHTYDVLGNLLQSTAGTPATASLSEAFAYDGFQRLRTFVRGPVNASGSVTPEAPLGMLTSRDWLEADWREPLDGQPDPDPWNIWRKVGSVTRADDGAGGVALLVECATANFNDAHQFTERLECPADCSEPPCGNPLPLTYDPVGNLYRDDRAWTYLTDNTSRLTRVDDDTSNTRLSLEYDALHHVVTTTSDGLTLRHLYLGRSLLADYQWEPASQTWALAREYVPGLGLAGPGNAPTSRAAGAPGSLSGSPTSAGPLTAQTTGFLTAGSEPAAPAAAGPLSAGPTAGAGLGLPPAGSSHDPLAPGFDPLAGLDPRPQHLALIDYTDAGDLPAGQPETFWYLHDRLGSVVAIADAAGQVVERYAYDPFGRTYRLDPDTAQPLLDATGQPVLTSPLANPHRWTGQRQDPATGLYLFPFRTFSPRLGQWFQRDPLLYLDSLNPYAYARHNPLRWTDPLGLGTPEEAFRLAEQRRGQAIYALDQIHTGSEIAALILETANDLNPITDFFEAATGRDAVTGRPLGLGERTIAASGFVPFPFLNLPGKSCRYVDDLLPFRRGSFRENLKRVTGFVDDAGEFHAHHVFPNEFRSEFDKAGINIDNPYFGMWWKKEDHLKKARAYNDAWRRFFRKRKNPTQKQIIAEAYRLADEFGIPNVTVP